MKSENLIQSHTVIVALLICIFIAAAQAQETQTQPKKTNEAPAALMGVPVQPTSFTYQGRLNDAGGGANGAFDFQFALFMDSMGGTAIGTVTKTGVAVTNGIFMVELDFGLAAFPDEIRWLEIRVKSQAAAEYTTLAPRQKITNAPFALRAARSTLAENALNALAVGSTPAAQIIKEGDARLTDSRAPAAGSGNYIQNQNSTAQSSTNFRIDGTGAANIFNAQMGFNIGGNRLLSATGLQNLFIGFDSGQANTEGRYNSFVGAGTGHSNTWGNSNTFVGSIAGYSNTHGSANTFVGSSSGVSNTMGGKNSFFGANAGILNTLGNSNLFAGAEAGSENTEGSLNSFVGAYAGSDNTTGSENSFFGRNAGIGNETGRYNTALGGYAQFGIGNLNFATAVGSYSFATSDNTIVLGKIAGVYDGVNRPADTVKIPGNLEVSGAIMGNFTISAANVAGTLSTTQIPSLDASKITAGTFDAARIPDLSASYVRNQNAQQVSTNFNISGNGTAGGTLSGNIINAQTQFNIGANRVLSVTGSNNTFAGVGAGANNNAGLWNSFFGTNAGGKNIGGDYNVFAGVNAGRDNTEGESNVFVGVNAGNATVTGNENSFFGTAAGFNNLTGSRNTLVGSNANVSAGGSLSFATALGAYSLVTQSDTIVLGKTAGTYGGAARPADTVQIPGSLNVVGNLTANGNVKLGASGNLFAASGEENLKIVRGHISVAGGNASVFSGSGYTVMRHSTGVFIITFTTPFSSDVVLTPSLISTNFNSPMTAVITEINNGASVRINVFNQSGALADPSSLLFIAVGVR